MFHLFLIRPFLRLFFGVDVQGRQNLAGLAQYIIVSNHNSHLDSFLLSSLLPLRDVIRTRPVAGEDYFTARPALHRVASLLFNPIWIQRGTKPDVAVKHMLEALRSGFNLILFPEGTRGEPGEIVKFKTGIGLIAEQFREVPIVPVYISGPEKSFPKKSLFPLPVWNRIIVGPPQRYTAGRKKTAEALERLIREMSEAFHSTVVKGPRKRKKILSIAVLGVDGSGKSSLSAAVTRALSESAQVCRVSDYLEFFEHGVEKTLQPLLEENVRQALRRYTKSARSLKQYKLPKLAELWLRDYLMKEIERWYAPDVVVFDGSPVINLAAWARIYKGDAFDADTCENALRIITDGSGQTASTRDGGADLPELIALQRLGLAAMTLPDAVILLDVPPNVCVERIRRRGEPRQVHETEEKLALLREGYLMACDVIRKRFDRPVLVVAGDRTMDSITEAALAFTREVPTHDYEHRRTAY
jgi:1-acyl-sn-glycerol-3-phosphate acyltransferase